MRMMVVTPFGTTFGGAEQWLLTFLRHADAIDAHVVMLRDGELRHAVNDLGFSVDVVPTGASGAAIAMAAQKLLAVLRERRPSVVVGNGVKAQLSVAMPARMLGIPSVWVKHDFSFDSILARPLGRVSTSVIAAAEELAAPVGRSDAVIVEPARPPEPLVHAAALNVLAQRGFHPSEHPTMLMLGRLVPYKGIDVALRALAYEQARSWRLVVIGDDDESTPGEQRRLRSLATSLAVDARVQFLGAIPLASRLIGAFQALAVLTRPGEARSPQQEGYGTTATEAMVAGVPVVYAGSGAVARRLQTANGPAGLVVTPADPLSTAKALARLADPEVRARMGLNGQAASMNLPGPDMMAANVQRALLRATDTGHGTVMP